MGSTQRLLSRARMATWTTNRTGNTDQEEFPDWSGGNYRGQPGQRFRDLVALARGTGCRAIPHTETDSSAGPASQPIRPRARPPLIESAHPRGRVVGSRPQGKPPDMSPTPFLGRA